ncbi:LLM class flavin-dependent oxidoreductase [Microbacterium betulae]|uniref:LLM class flavin-dependent oxidoreductase n=1 Tax=Microbacterium betulae TaxID=2981139 RepID=A0AA97FKI7_9MICO|nr:LLM class flavin-dependent oxidoreductase [Microbacterium sp. AB]WOF23167.1 LLM class flavin-dependent oxidoreductase [Microbacterium sp. AB]
MTQVPFAVAIELDGEGAHPAAALAGDGARALSARRVAETALAAERHGFTAVTFEDSPLPDGAVARLDAVQRAAYVAPLTSGIGLLPVVSVAFSEPFHVATQLASVDYASEGRAGWIVRAAGDASEAAAYGRAAIDDPAEVRREADDAIEVARRLWDSWQDDAVVRDVATGRYLDADRLHYADFEGASYSVKGPSIIPRPPQGQLVVAAGHAGDVDIVLVSAPDEDGVAARATAAREEGAGRVLAEIEYLLDSRGVTASDRLAALDARAVWEPGPRLRHVGDAAGLAALIARLAHVVDGVRLHPAVLDPDLDEAGRAVIPALRESLAFRSPVAGATLRETLGLRRPANRYERSVA